ncbi:glycosyltransferase family 4 protein [Chloroflexus sp.]|uniref:glycosyltransferase family 4 protein n=1 Tax=Chloroflexus sp. TaxID=1904827 RepID=UPI002ACDE990|nr:glycosyltransferase family 4 protein [Chloroflexus sp.]
MPQRFIVNIVTQMEAGGAQKAAVQICERLIEQGLRAEVWFLYKKRPTYTDRPYVRWLWDKKPDNVAAFLALCTKLYHWLRLAKPDGVITYTHYANIIGQTIARLAGIPHRLATQRNPSWSYPASARWIDWIIGSLGVYTKNIFVSHSVERSFQSYPLPYLQRSAVVFNGLRAPVTACDKMSARQRLALPADRTIIVSVGRLAHQKNHALLIEALCSLSCCQLVIAGDGELRAELERLIRDRQCADRVTLLGELPPQRIGCLLIAGDIFALPSRYEAFGFATVEAMMMGLPVVVSDLDVNREIIGDAGIFLPIDDRERWRDTFQSLAENESLRRELGQRAKRRAALYDLDRMVDGYIQHLFSGR